ncbi:molybdenum cofactor synthesis 2 [Mycena floridula]|nr:molybdenum cofactor synthesis 2 [Mycena floridula]
MSSSYSSCLEIPGASISLSEDELDTFRIISSVGNHGAGATAVFIGTTRNNFQGKTVVNLEYQAYTKLALNTMAEIVRKAQTNSHIISCAVNHRLGTVPVGTPSIVIAVSSPHRKEAFVACEFILEEVKRHAQIWKREHYEGDTDEPQWKSNA